MSLEKYKQVIHEDFIKDADFIDKVIKNLRLDKSSKILDIGTGIRSNVNFTCNKWL